MKISYKEYKEIMALKKEYFIQKLMEYELVFAGNGFCTIKTYIPMWLYIIAFIPMHIVLAVFCMWDGGLKEFELQSRYITRWSFMSDDEPYKRAKKIYEKA